MSSAQPNNHRLRRWALLSEHPRFTDIHGLYRERRWQGVKRQRTGELPRWRELGKDLWWDPADLQHLVSNHRCGRRLLKGTSHAFLTSIYLFLWTDSATWYKTSRTEHLSAGEAAAQLILNATGLHVGPSGAEKASKAAYVRCIQLSKSLSKPGGVKKLRDHLDASHKFLTHVAQEIQQDPWLLQVLRQNEKLEYQLNIIGELQIVNTQLAAQCLELDQQVGGVADENTALKSAVKTAKDAVKDADFMADFASKQTDLDKSLVSDGSALLARFGKSERELQFLRKNTGGTKVLSRRVVEVERLLLSVESNAAEVEAKRLEMEEQIEDLRARLKSAASIGRPLRRHYRDKADRVKELFLVARSAADYASQCS